ncbi:MAG: hypothetical protein NLN65_05690 [Candidatus Poseidoniaceae archaeon]|nr:hypothetical protein [Candidatus Poseidoniaceae archaeon]|tara:strand:- start:714 stop:1028 length:315 start_codon:yes stop_codon:yes gene_type:complete
MATKKEGAKRLLDTLNSKDKLQNRLRFAVSQGVLLSLLIGYFTGQWRFGLAAILLFGLLIQFSFERMKNSIEASQIQAIADLGWKDNSLSDEEYRARLMKVLNG